jgi:hypothetical protein
MKNSKLRFVLALFAGCVVSMVLITSLELMGTVAFPLPADVDPFDEAQIRLALEQNQIPPGALLCVMSAWVVGAISGSWVAARLALMGKTLAGWCMGTFIFFNSLMMLFQIPHPTLFAIGAIFLVPVASWLGTSLALRNSTPMVAETSSQ